MNLDVSPGINVPQQLERQPTEVNAEVPPGTSW